MCGRDGVKSKEEKAKLLETRKMQRQASLRFGLLGLKLRELLGDLGKTIEKTIHQQPNTDSMPSTFVYEIMNTMTILLVAIPFCLLQVVSQPRPLLSPQSWNNSITSHFRILRISDGLLHF